MATKDTIRQMLTLLAGAWPNNQANEATIAAYTVGLQDLEADALRAGVLSCLTSCKFFPTIAEIRAAVVLLSTQGTPTAAEAWEFAHTAHPHFSVRRCQDAANMIARMNAAPSQYIEIMPQYTRHIQTCQECFDGYEDPRWPHPLVEQIARQMGWPEMHTDNPAADRARYIDAYESALRSARTEAAALPEVTQLALKLTAKTGALALPEGGRR